MKKALVIFATIIFCLLSTVPDSRAADSKELGSTQKVRSSQQSKFLKTPPTRIQKIEARPQVQSAAQDPQEDVPQAPTVQPANAQDIPPIDPKPQDPADKTPPQSTPKSEPQAVTEPGKRSLEYPYASQKIDVDPVTGTASTAIAIDVPQGRAGIQPSLALLYNSGSPGGLLGQGWSLELGNIQRSTKKGIPKYNNSDSFVLIQSGAQQELVEIGGTPKQFRPKIEGAFVKIEFVNDSYWVITDKKGTRYFFGQADASRVYDPGNAQKRFKWCLDRVEDIFGNYLTVTYQRANNDLIPGVIDYTGNSKTSLATFSKIKFNYETRPDQRPNYTAGFAVTPLKRLISIDILVNNVSQRMYQFTYTQEPEIGQTLLSKVEQFGSDGQTAFPATIFTYSKGLADFYTIQNLNNYPAVNLAESNLVSLMDMTGDGLPDIVRTFPGNNNTWQIYPNRSVDRQVSFGGAISVVNSPFRGTDNPNVRFVDFNNDGLLDVIWGEGGSYRIWINNGTNGYNAPKTATNKPNHDLSVRNLLQFIDMNGDGLTDMVDTDLSAGQTSYKIYFNNGNVDFSGPVSAVNSPSRGTDIWDIKFADFNGDGLVDVIVGESCPYKIWVNNGQNGFESAQAVSQCPGIPISDKNLISFVDMNGDGLSDMVRTYPGNNQPYDIYYNNGNSDFRPAIHAINQPIRSTQGLSTKFIDMNGDGLTDVFFGMPAEGWYVSINNGQTGFQDIIPVGNHHATAELDNWNIMLVDMNGDNRPDMLLGSANELPYKVWVNQRDSAAPRGNLLTRIDNSVGGQSQIEYSTAPIKSLIGNQYKLTFSSVFFNVVKSTTQSTTQGSRYQTTYQYGGGQWNFANREFRGFATVRVTDAIGNYSETKFLQDDILKGRVQEQAAYDATGKLFQKTVNTWTSQAVNPGVNFVFLSKADNYVYDGNSTGRRTQEQYAYGETLQLGNLTKVVQMGEVNLTTGADIGADTRTVETIYNNNTASGNYLVGFPRTTLVKNSTGTVVRQSWFYYDGAQSDSSLPGKGLLTQKKDWFGNARVPDPVTKYSYDAYGNLLTTQDHNNHVTAVTYDATYQLFPLKTRNAMSQEITNEFYGINGVPLDSGGLKGLWGQLKSTTDPNNQKGTMVYDVLGRLRATISPLDSVSNPTSAIDYTYTSQYLKVTSKARIQNGQAATLDSFQFYDGLGRLIQSKARTETAGQFVISGQAEFDVRGLPQKQYLPFFSTNSIDTIESIDSARPAISLAYDALGRVIRNTNPDGTFSSAAYDDWTVTSTDENGHQQKSYVDAHGRLVKKEEYTGSDGRNPVYPAVSYAVYATTNYDYDSEGGLVKTTDALGNTTTITYDNLGRKTRMQDPDMGTWQYVYDAVGNLSLQTDSKNQQISFEYDSLNRLTKKTVPATILHGPMESLTYGSSAKASTKSSAQSPIQYGYDSASMTNSKGRLTRVDYSGSNAQFNYDALGRETKSVKTIAGTNYTVERSYDALNRLTSIKYPDNKEVAYVYNTGGQIETVSAGSGSSALKYIVNVDYNSTGQIIKIQFGNGNVTAYTYDPKTARLLKIRTINAASQVLQDLSYTYDAVGNIRSIVDAINTATQTFKYDDLGRLIQAVGNYGTKNYSYDKIGNITLKDGLTYAYGQNGAGKHAVTSLSDGTTFAYDQNGNMIRMTKNGVATEYLYDSENRLVQVQKNGVLTVQFEYDGDGGRTRKIIPPGVFPPDWVCLLVGSNILMADGTSKPIEQVREGDRVLSYDEKTMQKSPATVLKTFIHVTEVEQGGSPGGAAAPASHPYAVINGRLRLTLNHPVFANGQWVEAGILKVNDVLIDSQLGELKIEKVEIVKSEKPLTVYNLEVDGQHDYFADGILVHNKTRISRESSTIFVGSLYETTGSSRTTDYIFLGGMRIASVTNGQVVYYHADHLGGTNLLADASGAVKELIEYEPFGQFSKHEKRGTPQEVAWFYFTGKMLDEETGLIYFGARYYNPQLGRFLTPDVIVQSIANPQSLGRYSYASNNPVNKIDPTGHSWKNFREKILPHIFNAIRVAVDIVTFPVNPVGSSLDMASVIASYANGGDSRKVSQILGWSSLGWNLGQGIYTASSSNEVALLNKSGEVVTDYSKAGNSLATGINTTKSQALKTLAKANENLSIKYDSIIWNKTHGPMSDFFESGVVKYTGVKGLTNGYKNIIQNITTANPAGVIFDVHSEATILFTRSFQSLPASTLANSTVNFHGYVVLESTARNSFSLVSGGTGVITFDSGFSDPLTSLFGSLNPIRMSAGTSSGLLQFGQPHDFYGYLADRYPKTP